MFALEILKYFTNEQISLSIYGSIEDEIYWNKCDDLIKQTNLKAFYKGALYPNDVQRELSKYHFLFSPTLHENFGHVIVEFKTNAAFFINPGFIDENAAYCTNFCKNIVHIEKKPMTWEMVKELHQQGFVIGNHTLDHVRLVGLNEQELHQQIVSAKKRIEEQLNSPCQYFAWTYGKNLDVDEDALNYCLNQHKYVFGGDNYSQYFSFNNSVFNRRHVEGNWPISHVNYFLGNEKTY